MKTLSDTNFENDMYNDYMDEAERQAGLYQAEMISVPIKFVQKSFIDSLRYAGLHDQANELEKFGKGK